MRHKPSKLREDILRSVQEIESFCHGRTFHDFQEDRALQLIVTNHGAALCYHCMTLRIDY